MVSARNGKFLQETPSFSKKRQALYRNVKFGWQETPSFYSNVKFGQETPSLAENRQVWAKKTPSFIEKCKFQYQKGIGLKYEKISPGGANVLSLF